MPALSVATPKYRRHRTSGQAVVTLAGVDHYLGPYKSVASVAEYDRLVAEWLLRGRTGPPSPQANGLTVAEAIAAYWRHAKTYYRSSDGRPSSELGGIKAAFRPILRLYGRQPVAEFGPLALKVIREEFVKSELARSTINQHTGRIRRAFRWLASEELAPAEVATALATVDGLRAGKCTARETDAVQPVEDAAVEATLPHLPPLVADMVRLQRLTAMRPGELCQLRPRDLDRSGDIWVYRPATHKNAHRGQARTVFLGPQAKAVLQPYLEQGVDEFCFSPSRSEAMRRAAQHEARRTPLSCGDRPGTNRKPTPQRKPGECYTTTSYARCIARACEAAWPPPDGLTETAQSEWRRRHRWSPHQLRHAAATEIRRRFGLESAQVMLGHSRADVTQIYAARDDAKAREVAKLFG